MLAAGGERSLAAGMRTRTGPHFWIALIASWYKASLGSGWRMNWCKAKQAHPCAYHSPHRARLNVVARPCEVARERLLRATARVSGAPCMAQGRGTQRERGPVQMPQRVPVYATAAVRVPMQMWAGVQPSPRADVGRGEPSHDADVGRGEPGRYCQNRRCRLRHLGRLHTGARCVGASGRARTRAGGRAD